MEIIKNPPRERWEKITARADFSLAEIEGAVDNVLVRIREDGDSALRDFNKRFDGYDGALKISEKEWQDAEAQVSPGLQNAIQKAAENIRRFHARQIQENTPIETMPGVTCWRKSVAIDAVGLYIPGGTAPLFSTVLMLAIPAQIAGCKRRVLVTPPANDGAIHPAILYAAKVSGITEAYKVGGAQAIAALGFGTETIAPVNKIFGPGNRYVTLAKQKLAARGVAIDMPAGPSEVLVLADARANASFVAADLLAQAEHGPDSQVFLVCNSEKLAVDVQLEVQGQLARLPRKEIAARALQNSRIIVLETQDEMLAFSDFYAPEHLIINCRSADDLAAQVRNAGSVFVGPWTPEAAGDYASGTNHTLPTNGAAAAFSGVGVDSFCKNITYQKISAQGLQRLGPIVETMAAAEQLDGHKNSVTIRLGSVEGGNDGVD